MPLSLAAAILADFRHRFGYEPLLVRAPGRVNLIGEHTTKAADSATPDSQAKLRQLGSALSSAAGQLRG